MSSAIEVLKNWKSKMAKKVNIAFTQEEYNALDEVLLALEQKDVKDTEIKLLHKQITDYERILNGLNEWLEKEIEIIKQTQEEYGNKVLHEEIRKNVLKEVLDRVGEKK